MRLISTTRAHVFGLGGLLLLLVALSSLDAALLTGATSHPNYSVFVRGDTITVTFAVQGLLPNQTGLSVAVLVSDVNGKPLLKKDLTVAADGNGNWTGAVTAPNQRLGYYHVTARLSSGEELPAVGSRAAGYLTYMVVIDPKERVQPGEDAHFGMQGGFTTAFDARPYLGIHWVLSGYRWGIEEPDQPGQFALKQRKLRVQPDAKEQTAREEDHRIGILPLPTLLNGTPKWAVTDGKLVYTTGVIKEMEAWANYCREVGRAAKEDYPHLKRRLYQITWEPVYPWGFPGTDEDLVRDYQAAYPALHETDPSAFVLGPTGAGISPGDLAWNERLLKKGLGKYLDGYSIHPYIAQPPETHNLVGNIRALKEMIRTYVGHDLDLYGTEQGFATGGDPGKELSQALWLTRSYLIMLGEGFKANFAFYFADYPNEPGYGFFHNLNSRIPFGTDAVSPKPMAASYAALTMMLEGHKSVGAIEWLGHTALGYALERKGHVTLALWDYGNSPRVVKLPVGVESVEVFDWMGNPATVKTPGGTLTLTLGPAPQYVRGASSALWGAGAKRPLILAPRNLTAFPGDRVRLTTRVTALGGKAMQGLLHIELPESLDIASTHKPVRLRAGQQASFPLEFSVPSDTPFGAFPVKVTLEQNGTRALVGFSTAMLRVREPFSVERVVPSDGAALKVTVRNHRQSSVEGVARVRLRGVPDTRRQATFRIDASATTEIIADFKGVSVEPDRVCNAEITLADKSGSEVSGTYRATFLTAPQLSSPPTIDGDLNDWGRVPKIPLKGRAHVVRQPQLYHGRKDLAAEVSFAWDEKALYLAAAVTDDIFIQEREGFDAWHDDCLQLAFDALPGKVSSGAGNLLAEAGQRTNSEIDLALTKNGAEAYRTLSPNETKLPVALIDRKDLPLAIRRNGNDVFYEAAIPWPTLGTVSPRPSSVLGIALTVNDADDPKQPDPKALGLFGGITPTKDPTQFGQMVLVEQADSRVRVAAATSPDQPDRVNESPALCSNSTLAQSEPGGSSPIPWTGCVGAMADQQGRIWTLAGSQAFCLVTGPKSVSPAVQQIRKARLLKSVDLPEGMKSMRGDGRRMLCLSHADKLYSFDTETERTTLLAEARLPDGKGPRDIALGPKGDFYALAYDGSVHGWASDGKLKGEILRAKPGKDWWYCSLGVDARTGDFLLGSYWPDDRIYRFEASGKPLGVQETGSGYAALITTLDDDAWWLNVAGRAAPVTKSSVRRPAASGDWGYYTTGLAPDSQGGAWIACAQGLLHFDRKGRPIGERLGGLGDPGLIAAGPDGTVLVLVENGQRLVRLYADDEATAPFSSNANEPWRVGNGWTGRAVGLAWDGAGYLILDATAKCLWRFDPDHTGWMEKTWVRLTKEGAFRNPRCLAVGEALAYVLDGDNLLAISLETPGQPASTMALPSSLNPSDIVALAADDDDQLYVATATHVIALDHEGRERWKISEGFGGIVSLAFSDNAVWVADRRARRIVSCSLDGSQLTTYAGGLPGGLDPVGLSVRGGWAFIADSSGHRIVRGRPCQIPPGIE